MSEGGEWYIIATFATGVLVGGFLGFTNQALIFDFMISSDSPDFKDHGSAFEIPFTPSCRSEYMKQYFSTPQNRTYSLNFLA